MPMPIRISIPISHFPFPIRIFKKIGARSLHSPTRPTYPTLPYLRFCKDLAGREDTPNQALARKSPSHIILHFAPLHNSRQHSRESVSLIDFNPIHNRCTSTSTFIGCDSCCSSLIPDIHLHFLIGRTRGIRRPTEQRSATSRFCQLRASKSHHLCAIQQFHPTYEFPRLYNIHRHIWLALV